MGRQRVDNGYQNCAEIADYARISEWAKLDLQSIQHRDYFGHLSIFTFRDHWYVYYLHIFLKFLDREPLRRSDRPSEKISSFPSRMRDDISRPKFKIHEEFNKDWLMNFDSGRMQTTKRTTTTTSEYLLFIKPGLWILKSKT